MSSPITYVGSAIETIKGGKIEETESQYFDPEQVVGFRQAFSFLSDKDRDILYLIFVSRKRQMEVKKILKRSQPSLCYDIRKIRYRLKYIFYVFSNFDSFVKFLQTTALEILTEEEICVLTSLLYTTSFTMASFVSGYTQVKIRCLFKQSLDKLKEHKIWDMYEFFSTVGENQNSLKRVHKYDKLRFGKVNKRGK